MQAIGTAANILGVITPAKDVLEVITAIADSVDNVKRNKYKISSLMKSMKVYVERLHKARARCEREGATNEQIQSIWDLQRSLIVVWKELAELKQSQSNLGLFGSTFRQWWNMSGTKAKIEKLEMDIKQCHHLFFFESLDGFRQEVNDRLDSLNGMMNAIVVGNSDGRRSRYQVQCTTTMWKIPMKADSTNPKAMNYTYLSYKVSDLLEYVKRNSGLIEQLLQENMHMNDFAIDQGVTGLLPVGDPTRECEDAIGKVIQLSRAIKDQNSHISIIEWFDDLCGLGFSLYKVGLTKEALRIWQFEYRILTLLASERGSNVDGDLTNCLYNLAIYHYKERRYDEALPILEKAVEINRRLGKPFIPDLADSLLSLSVCFHSLSQLKEGAESLQESIDLFEELASYDPLLYGHEMAKCLNEKADLHYDHREYQKVIDCSEEAIQWLSKSSLRFKEDFAYDYAYNQWIAALAYKELGDFGKAEEYGREATNMYNRLIHDRPLFYLTDSTATDFSGWFREVDRSQDAIYILEESLTIYCSVAPSPAVQKEFADTLYRRAEIQHSTGKSDNALDSLSQVIDTFRFLLEEDETESNNLLCLLSAFRLRSSCLISLNRPFEAIKSVETALDILRSSIVKAELDESQIDSILKELKSQELDLKELGNAVGLDNLREYKRALFHLDEAILVFRQRTFRT